MDRFAQSPFLWGVATSSHQIEGGTENDHVQWLRHHEALGRDPYPDPGLATDSWNRWREDFALLKQLGVNSYRFSVEWSRIEPSPGRFEQAALDRYHEMIETLVSMGITPMVTLHHFTHPQWFIEKTPWHTPGSVEQFVRYVSVVARRLLARVPLIVTINEPIVWLLAAYADGKFPPGERNLEHLMKGMNNMLVAHREAYELIKSLYPRAQVGIAHNFIVFKRARAGNPVDKEIQRKVHHFYNLLLPEVFQTNRLKYSFPFLVSYDAPILLNNKIDFWGINYYCRMHVQFRFDLNKPFELLFFSRSNMGASDLGWEIYPRGLERVCRWLAPTGKPLYVTENGVAAEDDVLRQNFLTSHLEALARARQAGYPIRGYYHWSLLDNYEWLVGTQARFGLYHVDFGNGLTRTLKPSGRVYKDHIERNG